MAIRKKISEKNPEAAVMSRNIIEGLNEAKNRQETTFKQLESKTQISSGYLSQMFRSGECPLLTACALAIATGKRIVLID